MEHVEIEIERSKSVKCVGVLLDDELTWKEQVQSGRKWCFAGLARLRRLKDVLPPKRYIMAVLLLNSLAKDLRMKIERVQNYGMHIIL